MVGPATLGGVMERGIPDATVVRLPIYRRVLLELATTDEATVSSAALAELAGVNAAQVRKDLSYIGTTGVRHRDRAPHLFDAAGI